MTPKDGWIEVYERFRGDEPAGGDPTHEAWRVDRPDRRLAQVRDELAFPPMVKKRLLIGTKGTGKTTELYGLLGALPAHRVGVYFDVAQHVRNKVGDEGTINRMDPWEVLLLAGLAVWRAGKELGFFDDRQLAPITAAAAALRGPDESGAKVDAGKLAAAMTVGLATAAGAAAAVPALAAAGALAGGLHFLGEVAKAASWTLPIGLKGKGGADADQHARALLDAVNALLRAPKDQGWSFVLVLDGLDRLTDPAAIDRLFVESNLLGRLDAFTVATGPLELRRRGRFNNLAGWEPTVLAELRVFDHDDPLRPEPDLGFFEALWAARAEGLGVSLAPDALARLAWASGGRVREFVRLVQNLAGDAWKAGEGEASAALATALVEREGVEFVVGLTAGHRDLLQAILDAGGKELPDAPIRPDGTSLVDDLLVRYWLLPYRNGDEWFHPHPLLLRRLVLRRSTGSTSS